MSRFNRYADVLPNASLTVVNALDTTVDPNQLALIRPKDEFFCEVCRRRRPGRKFLTPGRHLKDVQEDWLTRLDLGFERTQILRQRFETRPVVLCCLHFPPGTVLRDDADFVPPMDMRVDANRRLYEEAEQGRVLVQTDRERVTNLLDKRQHAQENLITIRTNSRGRPKRSVNMPKGSYRRMATKPIVRPFMEPPVQSHASRMANDKVMESQYVINLLRLALMRTINVDGSEYSPDDERNRPEVIQLRHGGVSGERSFVCAACSCLRRGPRVHMPPPGPTRHRWINKLALTNKEWVEQMATKDGFLCGLHFDPNQTLGIDNCFADTLEPLDMRLGENRRMFSDLYHGRLMVQNGMGHLVKAKEYFVHDVTAQLPADFNPIAPSMNRTIGTSEQALRLMNSDRVNMKMKPPGTKFEEVDNEYVQGIPFTSEPGPSNTHTTYEEGVDGEEIVLTEEMMDEEAEYVLLEEGEDGVQRAYRVRGDMASEMGEIVDGDYEGEHQVVDPLDAAALSQIGPTISSEDGRPLGPAGLAQRAEMLRRLNVHGTIVNSVQNSSRSSDTVTLESSFMLQPKHEPSTDDHCTDNGLNDMIRRMTEHQRGIERGGHQIVQQEQEGEGGGEVVYEEEVLDDQHFLAAVDPSNQEEEEDLGEIDVNIEDSDGEDGLHRDCPWDRDENTRDDADKEDAADTVPSKKYAIRYHRCQICTEKRVNVDLQSISAKAEKRDRMWTQLDVQIDSNLRRSIDRKAAVGQSIPACSTHFPVEQQNDRMRHIELAIFPRGRKKLRCEICGRTGQASTFCQVTKDSQSMQRIFIRTLAPMEIQEVIRDKAMRNEPCIVCSEHYDLVSRPNSFLDLEFPPMDEKKKRPLRKTEYTKQSINCAICSQTVPRPFTRKMASHPQAMKMIFDYAKVPLRVRERIEEGVIRKQHMSVCKEHFPEEIRDMRGRYWYKEIDKYGGPEYFVPSRRMRTDEVSTVEELPIDVDDDEIEEENERMERKGEVPRVDSIQRLSKQEEQENHGIVDEDGVPVSTSSEAVQHEEGVYEVEVDGTIDECVDGVDIAEEEEIEEGGEMEEEHYVMTDDGQIFVRDMAGNIIARIGEDEIVEGADTQREEVIGEHRAEGEPRQKKSRVD